MEDKNIITVYNEQGEPEEAELILSVKIKEKEYILFRNKENEVIAAYFTDKDEDMHFDLTNKEYDLLDEILAKGIEEYDK